MSNSLERDEGEGLLLVSTFSSDDKDESTAARISRSARARRRRVLVISLFLALIVCVCNILFPMESIYNLYQENLANLPSHQQQKQQQQQQKRRLVVALSTIPSRIHLIKDTIESLIHQDLPPDTIYLTLPTKKAHTNTLLNYSLPNFIHNYTSIVTILKPQYDYGSVMKVLYVLEVEEPNTRIVFVDDDWIYPPNTLSILYNKSLQYPSDALCLSGAVFRNYFRQIGHTNFQLNRHPYLFMEQSGAGTITNGTDHVVHLAQGFGGVLVQPSFFDIPELRKLVEQPNLPSDVIKSDDFILSAHLAFVHVSIRIVEGGTVPQLTEASRIGKLSSGMHRHAMGAAFYLQNYHEIWKNYSFYNASALSQEQWNAIDCEAQRRNKCEKFQTTLTALDEHYPPIKQ